MTRLPGLLLLHGVGDSGDCWGPFIETLRSHGGGDLADLRIATPDAPAHAGRRSEPGHTLSWDDQLAEACAHADALASSTGRGIVVGGHSMGSAVALGVAATRPDVTAALFLEDPPFLGPMGPDAQTQRDSAPEDLTPLRDWFAGLQATSLDHVVVAAEADHPDWDASEYEPWARAKQAVDTGAFARPVDWVFSRWSAQARSVRCPVVVAAGLPERSGILALSAGDDLAELPNWSVHRLAAGHDVRRDAPARTAALLADLIRSVAV